MVEFPRDPFWISKSVMKSIVDTDIKHGFKNGASLLFKAYHAPTLGELRIPWCIGKVHFTTCSKYNKADYCRIDFYCPWMSCNVKKRWFFMKPKLMKESKYQPTTAVNFSKVYNIQKVVQSTSFPEKSYVVIEVICETAKHTHLKGLKGGIHVLIDQD